MKQLVECAMAGPRRARLNIYGAIGPAWAGLIDTESVADSLAVAGDADAIEVHINSPGGSAWDGLGIATLLKDHPAKIEVVIDGVALSAAAVIAMGGDSVRIPENGILMLHDPSLIGVSGQVRDFERAIEILKSTASACINLFAAKSGKSKSAIAEIMAAETWYVGSEAVRAGFADTTEAPLPTDRAPHLPVQQQAVQDLFRAPGMNWLAARTPQRTATVRSAADQAAVDDAVSASIRQVREEFRQQSSGPDAKYIGEYEANLHLRTRMTLAEYVASRRIDDGRDSLGYGGQVGRPAQGSMTPAASGPDAKYEAEFNSNPHLRTRMTVGEYIESRRIDDGRVALVPGNLASRPL